jgi:hypothetical protein
MRTDFDYPQTELVGPVVFRPDFNSNSQSINSNQAWSLFFTGGKDENALGFNTELGAFFTNLLIAIAVAGGLWATLFYNVI